MIVKVPDKSSIDKCELRLGSNVKACGAKVESRSKGGTELKMTGWGRNFGDS